MPSLVTSLFAVLVVGIAACAAPRVPPPSAQARTDSASGAVAALRAGRFDDGVALAEPVLASDPGNSHAAAVRAIGRYQAAMHQLFLDAGTVIDGAERRGGINHEYMRASLVKAEAALAAVEADLAVVARDPGFALELCLACWEHDWNRNGRVDESDLRLLQIEVDADGDEFTEDDPRRKPTFRLDVGDADWARAMVSFQRAFLQILLAYRWTDLDRLFAGELRGGLPKLTIRLGEAARVAQARELVLAGLDAADRARLAYLAERDDDREWLPSPRQKDHPLPLPVDEALYRTWADVVGDLRRLVAGKEGLSVAELAQLGDHQWQRPPAGFLDIGRLFSAPGDIVLDFATLANVELDDASSVEAALRSVLGEAYATGMRPSPLIGRLSRMKGEWDRGEESLERKLRYFLWLN